MPAKKKLIGAEKKEVLELNKQKLAMVKNHKIIGVDIGTNITGVFITGKNKQYALDVHNIKERHIRTCKLSEMFPDAIRGVDANNTVVIFEDYAYSTSATQLAEVGGCFRSHLVAREIPFLSVSPPTLKSFVLGGLNKKGATNNQKKQFVLLEVFDRWGMKFDDDNVCDAFCLTKFLRQAIISALKDFEGLSARDKRMFSDFVLKRGNFDYLPRRYDL